MKIKQFQIISLFFCVFVLTACHNKVVDPKEGIESYIDTYIYDKQLEKHPKEYFSDLDIIDHELDEQSIIKSLNVNDNQKENFTMLEKTLKNNLVEKTSYTVSIDKESKNKIMATIQVYGLSEVDEDTLNAIVEKNISELETGITSKTSEQDIKKISTDISAQSLNEWLSLQEKEQIPTEIETTLIIDPDNKERWLLQDESIFYEKLFNAFY